VSSLKEHLRLLDQRQPMIGEPCELTLLDLDIPINLDALSRIFSPVIIDSLFIPLTALFSCFDAHIHSDLYLRLDCSI
jgi:hypothetical protein